jgi:threonine dehydrogenase-like Zn-dependent dehydrogenase
MMNNIHKQFYDVVIVGAGSAGFAAAIAATTEGQRVCLVEKNIYSGGLATAAMVGTVCGLFLTTKQTTAQWAVGGFVKKFANELAIQSDTKPICFIENLHFLPYKVDSFKSLCDKYLKDAGVVVLYGANLLKVNHQHGEIQDVEVEQSDELIKLEAKVFVDCTGNAQLSYLSNPKWVDGGVNQAAARVFRMKGIAEMPSEAIHFVVARAIQKGLFSKALPQACSAISVVPGSFLNGTASFKLALPQEVTHDEKDRLIILEQSTNLVRQIADYLNRNVSAFNTATLTEIAPEVGFRTGYRSVGKESLTETMVAQSIKLEEGIANGAWPVEFWNPGEKVQIEHMYEGAYYQIPAGALESMYLKNLYFAGRNLSADVRAMASARVMGTCLQTGFAAGIMAAFAAEQRNRSEAIIKIRKLLELNEITRL